MKYLPTILNNFVGKVETYLDDVAKLDNSLHITTTRKANTISDSFNIPNSNKVQFIYFVPLSEAVSYDCFFALV
jgi:hypothetical protein